jgi:hypothetical protein
VAISNAAPASATTVSTGIGTRFPLTSLEASISSQSALSQSSTYSSSSMGKSPRQVGSVTSSSSGISTTQTGSLNASGTTLGQSLPSISTVPNTPNEPLITIGPYSCTATINLSTFLSQLLDYIQVTENTIGATLLYVTINIHAAADSVSPLSPAPMPSALPQEANLLGALFAENLSTYLYTPSELASNRADINGSWYTVPAEFRPVEAFYTTEVDENGISSTDDGWPTEGYIEFTQSKRLLVGFGTVDPQMSGYNFSGDHLVIFPSGYIQSNQRDINATSSGQLIQGCYFNKSTVDLSQVNSSWATGSSVPSFNYPIAPSSDISPFLDLTSNLTKCGISPFLNATLLNFTANDNFMPYENYSYASIWSWAAGEPRNQSSNADVPTSLFRCAMSKIDVAGRWVVNDCSSKTYAACRANDQPYNWTIATYPVVYSFADRACPDGYSFAVPRTALENSYLFQAIQSANRDYDQNGVWVDFNSLDTADCWVSGSNTTCPYLQTTGLQGTQYTRYVVVKSSEPGRESVC